MPLRIIPSVGCDIFLNGEWWGYRDKRSHAIETSLRLRAYRKGEIKIWDRATDEVIQILPNGQLHYGNDLPLPVRFEIMWPAPTKYSFP